MGRILSSEEKLPNKDLKFSKKETLKTKHIDLHGFTLEQLIKLSQKLLMIVIKKCSKIKVVTGKGLHSNVEKDPYVSKDLSILKYSVPEYIKSNQELMEKIMKLKMQKTKMVEVEHFIFT